MRQKVNSGSPGGMSVLLGTKRCAQEPRAQRRAPISLGGAVSRAVVSGPGPWRGLGGCAAGAVRGAEARLRGLRECGGLRGMWEAVQSWEEVGETA